MDTTLGPSRSIATRALGCAATLLAIATNACFAPEGDPDPSAASAQGIVDGKATLAHPATGLLLDTTDIANGSVGVCSGTIVGERTVLTAAHCLLPGRTHRFGVQDATGEFAVAEVVGTAVAPGYVPLPDGATIDELMASPDIGLAFLDRKLPPKPVALTTRAPSLGTLATLVGYGKTGAAVEDAGEKRETRNLVIGLEERFLIFRYVPNAFGLSCSGDSGGPALVRGGRGGPAVAGVTSFGDCASLSAYTRVDRFLGWIIEASKGDVVLDRGL